MQGISQGWKDRDLFVLGFILHSLAGSVAISGQRWVSELCLSTSKDRGLTTLPEFLAYLYMALTVEIEIRPYWEGNEGTPQGPNTLGPSP